MRVIIEANSQQVAVKGAQFVSQQIVNKPDSVLGLATGSTPVELYGQLINACEAGRISFADVTSFNLDEYIGIDEQHSQSYRYFMNDTLFKHIDIDLANTYIPLGNTGYPEQEAKNYEAQIVNRGGIDLQILGIGSNGHIGFNEPSSSLQSRTRVKTLTEQTMYDNSRYFSPAEYQPECAITMGIATIMETKKVVLLATGSNKAAAVKAMVEGGISSMCPASMLQMHPDTIVIVDEDAAQDLSLREYYRSVERMTEKMNPMEAFQ